ncbi:unnamed protein product, partial [Phaeothamnion confervicola]
RRNSSPFPIPFLKTVQNRFHNRFTTVQSRTDEYEVSIESDKLGMTVENVLERTVVRAVTAGSAAERAGVETGSLLTRLSGQTTRSMSHFET